MKYFNIHTNEGIETVDELNREDFKTFKEFRAELKRLVSEYRLSGMQVYTSQRATNDWKTR